jgi:prepilin-type N-terminal cleavage/methylation domain-containing protein
LSRKKPENPVEMKKMKTITQKMADRKGFSAIEVMTALGIATVFSAIAVPTFMTFNERIKLDCVAMEIVSEVTSVRMAAVSRAMEYRIIFADDGHYSIAKDANKNGLIDDGEVVVTKDLGAKYGGISVAATAAPRFFARGNCSGATVTLTKGNNTRTVAVNASGSAKIN